MGVDHVRMPVDYNVIQTEDGKIIESGMKHIDNCVKWSKEYGLNIVIDLHKTCSFTFDDPQYCAFFRSLALQEQFIALWQELARRYGNDDRIAFELLNEITFAEFAEPWNKIASLTLKEIRKIAPKTRIIVGGIFNSSIYGLTLLDLPWDENAVLTFRCYNPLVFTHQGADWIDVMPADFHMSYPLPLKEIKNADRKLFGESFMRDYEGMSEDITPAEYFKHIFAPATALAKKLDLPLYCGEYGVIDRADADSTLNWFRAIHATLEELKISRSVWNYKQMDFGITDEHYKPVYSELIKLL